MAMVTLITVRKMVLTAILTPTQNIKIMGPTQHIMLALFRTLTNIILSLKSTFSHKDNNSKQSIQPHINLLSETSHTVRTFLNRPTPNS
jgi:hypothetical protein